MKCPTCRKKNLNKANYCQKCGYEFSKQDKAKVKENFLVAILDKLDLIHDFITGDLFKNTILYRILSVLIVLGIGLYMIFTMGWKLRLLNNDAYNVKYNEELDTYYILIPQALKENETQEIDAAFYVPNRINSLDLTYYNEKDEEISHQEYEKQDRYTLLINTKENNYYILANHDDTKESLKIYVYYGE